jgi:hypothetical protein
MINGLHPLIRLSEHDVRSGAQRSTPTGANLRLALIVLRFFHVISRLPRSPDPCRYASVATSGG